MMRWNASFKERGDGIDEEDGVSGFFDIFPRFGDVRIVVLEKTLN